MKCLHCGGSNHIIKRGNRTTKRGKVQKYGCMECGRTFTDSVNRYSHYPLKVILRSIELYNLGHTVPEVRKMMGSKHRISPPERTIYSWTKRY